MNVASPAAGDVPRMPPSGLEPAPGDAGPGSTGPGRPAPGSRRTLVLLGALAAAACLVLVAATWQTHRIENNLTARAQSALTAAGIPVTVQYHGLDAVLTGTVTHPQQGADAIGTVIGVSGTRHVTSQLVIAGSGDVGTAPPTEPAPASSPQAGATAGALALPAGKITFATNDAALSAPAKSYLDEVASFLLAHPDVQVAVRGHSDDSGTDEINWALSKQRANAVVAYLVTRQVPTTRLHPAAFAATSPVAPNDTPDGRAANRRVELVPVEAP